MAKQSILVLGLFLEHSDDKSRIRTVEDRVASMFRKNRLRVLTSSSKKGRVARLADTVASVIRLKKEYQVAIIPLFGTWPSFIWQEVLTRLLKLLKKQVILGVHGGSIPDRIDRGGSKFLKAMKRADAIVAPSGYMVDYLKRWSIQACLIENPLDLSGYLYQDKAMIRPRVIWMRAFTEIYNPEMAVRVAARLAKKYPGFRMAMAGKDGPLAQRVREMVQEQGLGGSVAFPGYINLQEKLELAKDYDIYISTNKIDNAPVSVIEFMALGLPVVSVNVGGIGHLIKHEVNGLLVDADDDEAMCRQIERLIEDRSLAGKICKQAYAYARGYDEQLVFGKWVRLINELGQKDLAAVSAENEFDPAVLK